MALRPGLKNGMWAFIFIFWFFGTVWLFYGPAATSYPRRFDINPPGIGTLYTLRWSFDFWITAMYVLIWTVPITLAFALDGPSAQWRLRFHNVFVVLYALWLLATFIHGCIFWSNSNSTSPQYFGNPANDDRWCCVHFNLAGAPCAQNVACNPGVGETDLVTNRVFMWNLWWSFAFFVLLVVDFILSMVVLRPAFEKEMLREKAKQAKMDEPLLPDAIETSRSRVRYKSKGK